MDHTQNVLSVAPVPAAGVDGDNRILEIWEDLIAGFAREKIVWCYWKSSRRAAAALAGLSDLDILVAPASQNAARCALLALGFRQYAAVAHRADPSVECYLAYDEPSGLIVHLDLHCRLVVGGALLKTHRLPWEDALLSRAAPRYDLPLPVLDPASEAVLLMVRACFEMRRSDPVAARAWAATTSKFALDRARIAGLVDRDQVHQRATALLGPDLADVVTEAVFDPSPLEDRHALRRRIRRGMAKYRVYNAVEAVVRTSGRAICCAMGTLNKRLLHWPRPWNRRAPGGGVVVAILGVDGSGKSTLVRGLRTWLGQETDVLPLYFGTGDGRPSWFLLPLKLLVPLASLLLRSKPRGSSHGTVTSAAPGLAYSLLLALWATVLAVEKRMKLRAANRAAARGMIVITDRYPQDEILDFNDGPLLPRLKHVPTWLREFEASAYALARELPPDLVIKLVASPELIASREPSMDPGVIYARTWAVQRLTFAGAAIAAIPASQPAADVLKAAKSEIWRTLS